MVPWKWPSLDVAKSATQRSILGCGMDDVGQHTHDASNASCFRSKSVWNNISGPILMTLQILCDNSNWLSGKFCHRPQFIRRRTVCNESRIVNVRSCLQPWNTFLLKQDHIKWHLNIHHTYTMKSHPSHLEILSVLWLWFFSFLKWTLKAIQGQYKWDPLPIVIQVYMTFRVM